MKQVTLIAVLFFSLVSFSLFAADISTDFPKSDYIAQEGFGKSAKLAKSEWKCIAYINRTEAWKLLEPEVRQKCDEFYSLYKKADFETEPIYCLKGFTVAQKAAEGFSESFLFASLFSKELTEKSFGEAFNLIGSLSSKKEEARKNCTLQVAFTGNDSQQIKNAVISAFSECGFKAGTKNIFYTATITVDYGLLDLSGVTVCNPSFFIELIGKSGTIYSFSASSERVSGIDSKLTKAKAEEGLSSLINQKLSGDIKKSLGI